MPATQVRGGDDDDDEPTFPTARDPIRHPTQNPRINPETGLPQTTEVEKWVMREILEKRFTDKTKESEC